MHGLVTFIPAVNHRFSLYLPATFSQPCTSIISGPSTGLGYIAIPLRECCKQDQAEEQEQNSLNLGNHLLAQLTAVSACCGRDSPLAAALRHFWQQQVQKERTRWASGQSTGPKTSGTATAATSEMKLNRSVSSCRTEHGTKRAFERICSRHSRSISNWGHLEGIKWRQMWKLKKHSIFVNFFKGR